MRIAIGTPARDDVKTRFCFDLVNAVASHMIGTDDVVIPLASEGTMLASQRCELVQAAIAEDATHLLFIDSDMRFPFDTIGRLLSHGRKVVGANCARRKIPTGPTAANFRNGGDSRVYTMPESTGLEKVDFLGTGVLMIEMNVFRSIQAPWFATPWVRDRNSFMGEDIYFCRKLAEAGFPVYVDHDLSKEIGHIGAFEFRHEHTYLEREPEPEKQLVVM